MECRDTFWLRLDRAWGRAEDAWDRIEDSWIGHLICVVALFVTGWASFVCLALMLGEAP